MKTKTSVSILVAWLFAALFASVAHAQDAATATTTAVTTTAPTDATVTALVTDVATAAAAKFPWLITALGIFGALSVAYQAVIAYAHKRAAATADAADDDWLASLESKAWFKILDRVFYWGGYLGSMLGGKKL